LGNNWFNYIQNNNKKKTHYKEFKLSDTSLNFNTKEPEFVFVGGCHEFENSQFLIEL
jgi:hypothetical protein